MQAEDLRRAVRDIVSAVRERGDDALIEYTERWDRARLSAETLRVPLESLREAVPEDAFSGAFRRATERIERFHRAVKPRSTFFEDDDGVLLGMRWTPIRAVGLYVPGGKASYPSTLAMTVIPARIAGVERIVVVSPPGPDGEVSSQVLLAARMLGVEEVYRVGGAQAIAALAIGTASIPRVDKIFGPGNAFVAEAKSQLFGEVGIDLVAGPSEVVVYADETADPEWVAADLLAQAEHDESTSVTLLATSASVLRAVRERVERLLAEAPRREVIEISLGQNGRFEVVRSHAEATARINEIAPEHLSIQVENPWDVLPGIQHAGAIFLGKESPVAVGDYYAGPNHVLPTGRSARFASCLSVEDFMKRSNVSRMSLDWVRRTSEDVDALARAERLPSHALSVTLRRKDAGRIVPRGGVRGVASYDIVEESATTKLNQNESPWDVPDEIKDEVARRLRELPWHRYHQTVPDAFLARLGESAGLDARGVIAASGSNLILQWIFDAWGGPGRTILLPAPSFSLYPLWAQTSESRVVEVPLREDLSYDPDRICEAITASSPHLVVLCLPNNPTGTELSLDATRRIARAATEVGALVVIDEAYREFSAADHDRTPLLSEFENLVLLRTFSKAFAAAGLRLGYLFGSPGTLDELRKVVPPFHLNLFAAVFGQVVFENRALFDERVRSIVAERERLTEAVSRIRGAVALPSEANFFLLRVPDAPRAHAALRSKGVLVRRVGGHVLLESCLRVSVGTREENDRFLVALAEHLETSS